MSTPKALIKPIQLSPEQQVRNSPQGLAYDFLIKPPSSSKVIVCVSPSPVKPSKEDIIEKLKSAEERKKIIDLETVQKNKEKGEKIKNARRQILESMEVQQKQILEKVQKKTMTVEEILAAQRKEQEEKRISRELRALEAKKTKEELLESKRLQLVQKQEQLKLIEDNREAQVKAKIEKARIEYEKSEAIRAEKQKKIEELDERSKQNLNEVEQKREAYLQEISVKCGKHVEDAKRRAAMIEERRSNRGE